MLGQVGTDCDHIYLLWLCPHRPIVSQQPNISPETKRRTETHRDTDTQGWEEEDWADLSGGNKPIRKIKQTLSQISNHNIYSPENYKFSPFFIIYCSQITDDQMTEKKNPTTVKQTISGGDVFPSWWGIFGPNLWKHLFFMGLNL